MRYENSNLIVHFNVMVYYWVSDKTPAPLNKWTASQRGDDRNSSTERSHLNIPSLSLISHQIREWIIVFSTKRKEKISFRLGRGSCQSPSHQTVFMPEVGVWGCSVCSSMYDVCLLPTIRLTQSGTEPPTHTLAQSFLFSFLTCNDAIL